MKTEIRDRLLAQISAPVAWGVAKRDQASPYVVLNQISGESDYTNDGPSGYARARIQVDCFGASFAEAEATGAAVLAALSGWRAGVIQGVFKDADRSLGPDADIGETLFRRSLDFQIHYSE